MLRKKDRLNRKSNKQDEAGFTDDGFALGCAFLLRVLGLYGAFDALHWWETVEIWLQTKDKKLQQSKQNMGKGPGDNDGMEDEEEEWNISYKRNMALSKEWKLLFFGFQASRIFFRVVEKHEEEGVEGTKDDTENDDEKNENVTTATPGGDSVAATPQTSAAPPPQERPQHEEQVHSYPTPVPQQQQQNENPMSPG